MLLTRFLSHADLIIDTDSLTVQESVDLALKFILPKISLNGV